VEDAAPATRNGAATPEFVLVPPVGQGAIRRRRAGTYTLGRVALDVAMLTIAGVIALASADSLEVGLVLLFAAVTVGLLSAWRAYAPRLQLDAFDETRLAAASTAVAAMSAITAHVIVDDTEPTVNDVLMLWLLSGALLCAGRIAATAFMVRSRRSGHLSVATVIVGAGHVGRLTASRLLAHPEFGLRPIGFLDKDPLIGRPLPLPVLGASWDVEDAVRTHGVACAVFTFSNAPHDVMLRLLDECERLGVRALIVPRLFERVPSKLQVTHVGALPLLELLPTSPRSFQYAIKYALDRLLALGLIVLLSPVMLAVALAVRLSLGRPLLYRQCRVGLDGRRFEMLKFRTMAPPTDDTEPVLEFTPENAPGGVEGADRRTRVGAFLRHTSLDELAQLFNVLKGEMSLVGPRPERPEYVEYFGEHVRRYAARHRVKAGITGWAQIHRLRGQTSITDRVEWDNYYIENFSLWLDLKILLRTIPEVLRGGTE
jgi:exopolysaccharide biosynthesis polyprenyl glycosylphosphotransferase